MVGTLLRNRIGTGTHLGVMASWASGVSTRKLPGSIGHTWSIGAGLQPLTDGRLKGLPRDTHCAAHANRLELAPPNHLP